MGKIIISGLDEINKDMKDELGNCVSLMDIRIKLEEVIGELPGS